ncbi:MAG: hypothetical protein AAB217_12235 [Chloroflexota bacterium]
MTPFDYDLVDPDASDMPPIAYPLAQWHNGKPTLKALKNIAYTGGLFLPSKFLFDGLTLPGWSPVELTFGNGKTEAGLATAEAMVAAIRTRFRWTVRRNGITVHYPRAAYLPDVGMRGNLQVLCAVQGCADPIALTFTGKGSQFFETLLKDFAGKVVTLANRNAPKGKFLPRYAFWMSLKAGGPQKAKDGETAIITPPTLALPDEIALAYLQGRYVGKENLLTFQDWYREAEAWATAWDKPGAADTADAPAGPDDGNDGNPNDGEELPF